MAAAQGSYFALQFGASIVLARLLSPHDMGVFAIALATISLLALVQAFGLGSLIVREPRLEPDLLATAFTINALIGVLLAATTAGLGLFGAALLREQGVASVLLVLAAQPLIAIFEFLPASRLEREGDFKTIALVRTLRSAIATALTIVLAFKGFSYMSLAWGQLAGAAFNAVALNVLAPRHVSFRISLKEWRAVARFGRQMLAVSGVNALADRMAEILLGRIIDLAAIGLYARASSMFHLLWNNIHIVMARILLVDFADLVRRGVPLRDRYLRVVALMTGALWPGFAGLAILSRPLVQLIYGPQWLGAALPLSMLSIAAMILVSITMTWQVFIVSRETDRQARIEFLRSGVGLALFTAGCFVNLTTAAATRIADALFSVFLYRPHMERMTGATRADLAPIYRSSAIATLAAVAPAAALMALFRGSPTIPAPYVMGAIAAGVALWLAALWSLRHPLFHELAMALRRVVGGQGRGGPLAHSDDFFTSERGLARQYKQRYPRLARLLDRAYDLSLIFSPALARLRCDAATAKPRNILVVGIEAASRPGDMVRVAQDLISDRHQVSLSIWPMADQGKFANVDAAIGAASTPLAAFDWLIIADDDVEVAPGFLDEFIAASEAAGLAIAQPAHRFDSYANFGLTHRRWGALVRETRFVEIGPLTALRRETFDALIPFPRSRWCYGIDVYWASIAQEKGWKVGVVDATPIRHLRPVAKAYDATAAIAEGRQLLVKLGIPSTGVSLLGAGKIAVGWLNRAPKGSV